MFAGRTIRTYARLTSSKRAFSQNSYKETSFKQAWLSDVGSYPPMLVTVFGIAFVTFWGVSTMNTHPDCRISKTSRKSLFRGPLKGTPTEYDA